MTDATPAREARDSPTSLVRLVLVALVIGGLTGLVGAWFRLALLQGEGLRDAMLARSHDLPGWGWLVPVLACAAAAAFARFLVRRFAPTAAGSGIPRVEAIVREGASPDSAAVLPVKFVGGLASISAGLALGREGPTVQIGATLASSVARLLRVPAEEGRVLVAGGSAAGLATAFGAPLGGAVFILEEVLQRFDGRTTLAVLGATGSATLIAQLYLGSGPEFVVHAVDKPVGVGVFLYLGFGLLLGVIGAFYNRAILAVLDLDARLARVPAEARAAAIGAGVGLLAWVSPGLVGGGDTQLQQLLLGDSTLGLMLWLLAARLVLGPVSYASGTPGGLFAPILLVGGVLGAIFGLSLHLIAPSLVNGSEAFVLIGMVAFFTATVRAPVTGIALIVEMTGVSALFMPLLIAACGAFMGASLLRSLPIYDALRARAKQS